MLEYLQHILYLIRRSQYWSYKSHNQQSCWSVHLRWLGKTLSVIYFLSTDITYLQRLFISSFSKIATGNLGYHFAVKYGLCCRPTPAPHWAFSRDRLLNGQIVPHNRPLLASAAATSASRCRNTQALIFWPTMPCQVFQNRSVATTRHDRWNQTCFPGRKTPSREEDAAMDDAATDNTNRLLDVVLTER